MKFLFLIAFLVFSPQLAAANDCPTGKDLAARQCRARAEAEAQGRNHPRSCTGKAEARDAVLYLQEKFPLRVNHEGAYGSPLEYWNFLEVGEKEQLAIKFAIYRNCYIFGMDRWHSSIKIFDYSGKEIGELPS